MKTNYSTQKNPFKIETVDGDIHTPVSIFQKLEGENKFLLESSQAHHDHGRYSYIGCNPFCEAASFGEELRISDHKKQHQDLRRETMIDFLEKHMAVEMESKDVPELPFTGGAVGYLGYDAIRQYEDIGAQPLDDLKMPDAHFLIYDEMYIFDHILQVIHLVTRDEDSMGRFREMKEVLNRPLPKMDDEVLKDLIFESNYSKEQFTNMVNMAKEAIVAGEVFQVVLSQRFESGFHGNPFRAYRRLRLSNPSPYMFYIEFRDYTILGSSPESLISVRGNELTANPIAGTRPRGKTEKEDMELEIELLNDEKELAEHRMLVDLARNDVGKVSKIGSVSLASEMTIERFQHVMHIASKVKGQLKEGTSSLKALIACLPAGTVSGAPKIRAMQLINTFENRKRGVYAGSIGYIGFGGNLDMALAIRTMVVKDNRAFIQAGAGIVYDSDPEKEYEETKNKAKALMEVYRS
ncbi:anthranilate synthase, component I [Bacillus sp. OV322]|uniref:anthranilate synthase component I n=1 Tax=Bacillus sp. OV322 TaxID=1882764 RepID=UPI0008EE00D3|nr:anthranilate synthase component I [Bacillus sp. OV322]SFC04079.1 anthranilate synthase, component I [Bacillus sp. OV322]